MGNSRSGGAPPRDGGGTNSSSSISAGREDGDAGAGAGNPRRSAGAGWERGSAGNGNATTRSRSDRKRNGAAAAEEEEAPPSAASQNSAMGSLPRGSGVGFAGSPQGAGTPTSERAAAVDGDAGGSSKKRKRTVMKSSSYIKRFKPIQGASAAGVVVSPDRVGKENTSSGHVANSNVSKVQPRKPIGVPLQNIASESSLPGKTRNRPTAPARQSCLPSLQSVPISPVHHEEMRNTLGDKEPIIVQKEDSASGHEKVMPSDETDGSSNICVSCGTPGTLRSCDGKGCQTGYHVSCLDPSLEYLSPGIWFCTSCTDKRFQFGLHSIVDGIESVWDVKEAEGMQNSKQYFVKYKNLAHVHNCWVPEGDIDVMPGGPHLLSLFNKRNHTEKAIWKEEWTKPHRLLRKRLLIPPKLAGDSFSSSDNKYSYCTLEWLVKWRGLGYDHATWELETLPCLCTPEADQLKNNYENRREAAKQSSILTKAKVKQSSFQKLQKLPDGCHSDFDNDHLCSINHLREFWYESRGAVLVDDKEFVKKTILFTRSVLSDVRQPILIVTTPASLSLWEVQFNTLAPFINVVVYDGGKDKLKLIQDLEFYESGSCIMLQVLLSHADAILEDLEPIARISWEAVIVDYYQKSTLQYLDQLKQLSTDFRMLLVSSPIKDNLPEYVKLLGFLNPGEQENGNCIDNEALVMSKKNFKDHVAYERRADSSKILEYWVPAYISQLQLEIYCSILLSNSSVLQSKMRSDNSLSNIMMSLSKCCDHPYLVDEFLQNSPVNNHNCTDETINTKVQACGKLLLLQEMLKEIRNKRLRVIILFHSGVSGGNSMGDLLEGVVCERFGRDSYERVENGIPFAKKHAAVRIFNDKSKGRFVFLIESRACVPSIELSSVDAIIIYNSDCNPLNDLEVLQRIKIESKLKYPSIFRLYTPFTMDEKQLMLAKHGVLIDNYKDMPHSLGHSLISWGASFLFTRLSELQHDNYASKSFEGDTYSMDKVILEFLKKLATKVEDSTKIISKANKSGEFYSRNITLIGENVAMPSLDGDPSIFWLSLLDEKSHCWSNISKPPQSSPRMLQNVEEPAKVPAEEADEVRRKRRKVDGITVSSSKCSSENSNDDMFPKIPTTFSPALQQLDEAQQKKGVKTLMSTPKNLHVQLKQELSKLIKVLQLPDPVILMSKHFLEYVLKNHHVVTEPVSILHTFMIALCWRAACFLNCEVDFRELVALPKKNLNWECNEDLVAFFYRRLRTLEKEISDIAGETSIMGQPVSAEDTQLSCEETSTNLENDHMLHNKEMNLDGKFTNGASHAISTVAEQMISMRQEPVQETLRECHVPNAEVPNMIVKKSIDLVDNVFSLRENNILCKQQLEISGLVTHRQNNVIRLKSVCCLVLEHIRRSQIDEMTKTEKIKLSAQWFTMLMFAFLEHMKLQYDKLEGLQSDTWSLERQLKEKLHQVAKSGQLDRDFDQHITLPDSNFVMEEFIHFKEQNDVYLNQEPSTSECRNTEHIEIDNIAKPSMLLGGATSLVRGVHANNDDILDTDGVHLDSTNSASSESLVALVGTQAVLSCMSPQQSTDVSAQQNVAPSRCPPAKAEQTGLSDTQSVQVLQPEMQPSILLLDGPPQKTHPDDSSQTGCDRATRLSQGGAATSHHLGDVQMQVQEKDDGNAAADPVLLESPAYRADSPVSLQVSAEVESQIQEPSMAAKQSASPPTQQSLAILRHPPAEAEPSSISGTVAAWDLQPEVQSSTSMQDEPAQVEDEHEVEDEPVGRVTAHDLQSEIQPSASVPAEQSTGLLAQQSLATSQHPPAEAQLADILGTQPACDLQPEVQSSTSVQDEPAESEDEPAEVEDEPEVPEVEDESEAEDEPAKADRAGTLGAIAAQNLHPEMQSSTSTQDVPSERTYMSYMPVLESLAINRSVEPSLDPHAGVESAGMVTAHDLQSEILPSASMPTEQSTSPPAQQSLATSGHSPAQAEPADMMGTEAACHLQPSQGEVQPLTTMQDQPAEEQACILGAISGRNLQPETQPSTSTQSAPFETTYLVGTPVLQSPTLHHSVEPSLDPYARAESTHTLGLLIARDLQSEVQPSASTQDQPPEAEVAVMLGSTAAQDLLPELQSSTAVQQVPLEGTGSEERGQNGFQPNMVPGPEQPTQHPPVTTLALNSRIVSGEPLKNELDRLMHCNNLLSKDHEHKKSLLLIEYKKELEKIKMKYDSLLQKEDSAYIQTQKELAGIYRKVYVNKTLAENFRGAFTPSAAAPGRSTAAIMAQPFESFSAAQTTASPVISSSAIRAPARNPPGSHVRPLFVAQPSSPSWDTQQLAVVHGNFYGMPSSPFVEAPVPYGSYGSTGAQPRAVQPLSALASNLYRTMSPVPPQHLPHSSYRSPGAQLRDLQQFRMPSPYAVHSGQQQLPASPAVTSFGQYAVLNSMDPSSAQQTILPPASSSRPPLRVSSLPPGRQESGANFLQSSSSNPIFMPPATHRESAYRNMVFGGTPGPQNAAPGSQQQAGAQIAGNQSHRHMPARFGLGSSSSPTGTRPASPLVVCLSDDES